eukprot:gene3571-4450_t
MNRVSKESLNAYKDVTDNNEVKSKKVYEPFSSNFGISSWLDKKLAPLLSETEWEDMTHLLFKRKDCLEDILNRLSIPPEITLKLVKIFSNRLISERIGFIFKELVQRFSDGINNIPSELYFEIIELNKSTFQSTDNDKFEQLQYWSKLIKKKSLYQNESLLDANIPIKYHDIPIEPVLSELKSDFPEKELRSLKTGMYNSTEEYLDTQYCLTREDYIHPLRETLRSYLDGNRDYHTMKYIYNNVKFENLSNAFQSIGYQISFRTCNNKPIQWGKSTKLMKGSLVGLSNDNFNSIFWATIDQRPDYKENIQEIKIVFLDPESDRNIPFFFVNKFQMIESPSYFEAHKNVLMALKLIEDTDIPFKKYLVDGETEIEPPMYIKTNPRLVFGSQNNIFNVLTDFPDEIDTLDSSQLAAFRNTFRSELSIIVGPPGTGKSYLGLQLVKNYLKNYRKSEQMSPILVVCYTNHALDQFVSGIIPETEKIVRIGSQSRMEEMDRFNINKLKNGISRDYFNLMNHRDEVLKQILKLLTTNPLIPYSEFMKLLSDDHEYSFQDKLDLKKWLNSIDFDLTEDGQFILELTKKNNEKEVKKSRKELIGNIVEYQEEDEEDEEMVLEEIYRRNFDLDLIKEEIEKVDIGPSLEVLSKKSKNYAQVPNPTTLSLKRRHKQMNYWRLKRIKYCLQLVYTQSEKYRDLSKRMFEVEQNHFARRMRDMNIIGATTSGASRMKNLLERIRPRLVIIEEAAEVLESHVISILPKSVQHLVLIGDHFQLRPNVSVYKLCKEKNLDISLFERLQKSKMNHVTLEIQRRMMPNISQFIKPIYSILKDHESLVKRFPPDGQPFIRGMRSNVYFLDHRVPEDESQNGTKQSKVNRYEAGVIIKLASYLHNQGYNYNQIVILTPYTGQLLKIKKLMEAYPIELRKGIRVRTVDLFQGEEADIILVSLVRSNASNKFGFLSVQNRINVTLSRAKNGMFIIGNSSLLMRANPLWKNAFQILQQSQCISSQGFSLQCQNHPDDIKYASKPEDFPDTGSCEKQCDYRLNCGHVCVRNCHVDDRNHTQYICRALVIKPMENCNHERELECHVKQFTCIFKCDKIHEQCQHQCTKMCIDQCGECLVQVERTLACGHLQNEMCHIPTDSIKCQTRIDVPLETCGHVAKSILCSTPVSDIKCKEPVVRELPCGHKIDLQCSTPYNSMRCRAKVPKILACGHEIRIPCGSTEIDPCPYNCNRIKECGHRCTGKCSEDCNSKPCNEQVNKILDCGHSVKMKCSDTNLPFTCKVKCHDTLPCGQHKCEKECSTHSTQIFMGTKRLVHPDCNSQCKLLLACNHPCENKCGEPCSTVCTKNKTGLCSHQKNKKDSPALYCYQKSEICEEKCINYCQHRVCLDPCSTPCTIPRCNEPCNKKVKKCKKNHTNNKCIGLCGEVCPGICRECSPDAVVDGPVEIGTQLSSFNENHRFIQLPCNHLFEVSYMDQYVGNCLAKVREFKTLVNSHHPFDCHNEPISVKMLSCPKCHSNLYPSIALLRYKYEILTIQQTITESIQKSQKYKTFITAKNLKEEQLEKLGPNNNSRQKKKGKVPDINPNQLTTHTSQINANNNRNNNRNNRNNNKKSRGGKK